jgi:hypothetical protein
VIFGDENTKIFHIMATHSSRKNFIIQLYLHQGDCLIEHKDKVEALWHSFKKRLGVSKFSQIHFQSDDLFQPVALPIPDNPFSIDKIDLALKEMPLDHALGPNGFNGLFYKKMLEHNQVRFQ